MSSFHCQKFWSIDFFCRELLQVELKSFDYETLKSFNLFRVSKKNQDFKNTRHRHGEYNKNFWNKKFFFKQILISFSTKKAVETICIKTKIIFISFVFCPYCAWLIKKLFNNRRGCLLHESVKIVVSAYPNPQFAH